MHVGSVPVSYLIISGLHLSLTPENYILELVFPGFILHASTFLTYFPAFYFISLHSRRFYFPEH